MDTTTLAVLVSGSIVAIILLTSKLKVNAFLSLFLVSLMLAILALPGKDIVQILKEGFGNTMGATGFLIIFGAVIAIILDKTGAAISMAKFILSKTGQKHAAAALGTTGFIAGMSIFCDSGFIILSGLAKSFSARSKVSIVSIATILGSTLLAVHCLVPTHPGALAAAGILQVNIGMLVLMGIVFAIPGALAAYFFIKIITKHKNFPPAEVDEGVNNDMSTPPVLVCFIPVILPLLLIGIGTIIQVLHFNNTGALVRGFLFLGQPVIALLAGVLSALFLLRNKSIHTINEVFEFAIAKAGPILIVTAAGGMFGLVIKETGLGTSAAKVISDTSLGLAVPFLIAFVLKTAQGSSTVAVITAASIMAPMLPAMGLGSEQGKLFSLLAMGAGSMMISHANDSYFWVITRFSGISMNSTLRVFSTATIVMGITVFTCVYVVWLMVT